MSNRHLPYDYRHPAQPPPPPPPPAYHPDTNMVISGKLADARRKIEQLILRNNENIRIMQQRANIYRDEISALQQETAQLTDERDEARLTGAALAEKVNKLTKELDELRRTMKQLTTERDEARQTEAVLTTETSKLAKELDELRRTMEQLTKERDEARQTEAALAEKINKYKRIHTANQSAHERRMNKASDAFKALQAEANKTTKINDQLKQQLCAVEESYSQVNARLGAESAKVEQSAAEIAECKSVIVQLRTSYDELTLRAQALTRETETLRVDNDLSRGVYDEALSSICDLKATLASTQADAAARTTTLTEDNKRQAQTIDELRLQIRALEAQLAESSAMPVGLSLPGYFT